MPPLYPRLPEWARWAGAPEPEEGETFASYVARLGLDPGPMLVGLSERSRDLANLRLAGELRRRSPESFERYMAARRASRARS